MGSRLYSSDYYFPEFMGKAIITYKMTQYEAQNDTEEAQNDTANLSKKRYVRMVSTTAKSQLRFSDRLVWSALVRKLRYKGGMKEARLEIALGLSRKNGVRAALSRLHKHGLVTRKNGLWYAVKPPAAIQDWFADRGYAQNWYDRLAYFRLYLPKPGELTMRQSAILGLLMSPNIKLAKQTPAGLAALLTCDARTVAKDIKYLCSRGLIMMNGDKITELRPDPFLFLDKEGTANRIEDTATSPANRQQQARAKRLAEELEMTAKSGEQRLRSSMKLLGASTKQITDAVNLTKSVVSMSWDKACTLLAKAKDVTTKEPSIALFMFRLKEAVDKAKQSEAEVLAPPIPLARTAEVTDMDYWLARISVNSHEKPQLRSLLNGLTEEELRKLGQRLPPYHWEDEPGKSIWEQDSNAADKRMPLRDFQLCP